MNAKTKRRLIIVTGLIVVVAVVVLAVVGSAGAARGITVADALQGTYGGQRVQITGAVADDSYEFTDDGMTFAIKDADGPADQVLRVSYEGAASSTFGNGVTAICTGVLAEDGEGLVLNASEMVTQCPSKYESATDALRVSRLVEYGEDIVGTTVKVAGVVQPGTLAAAGFSDARFVLADAEEDGTTVSVAFDGGMPEGIVEGSSVVLTGALTPDGMFAATNVAQEG